jgi:hypothetical protein
MLGIQPKRIYSNGEQPAERLPEPQILSDENETILQPIEQDEQPEPEPEEFLPEIQQPEIAEPFETIEQPCRKNKLFGNRTNSPGGFSLFNFVKKNAVIIVPLVGLAYNAIKD